MERSTSRTAVDWAKILKKAWANPRIRKFLIGVATTAATEAVDHVGKWVGKKVEAWKKRRADKKAKKDLPPTKPD